ncbi:hypothetical protein L3Q72_15155 [Vibrio sp. JC009]|uniref:hypothetical protein n=1 Tax=Vibrio sp. JC009 TaxID=2912314 RepID=UPI0023B17C8A|nr:hypothetical protein [Vibrio sp. JC009]WED24219.1 hypothetical protein L3Q72_15155 [Vibrio sp. JC009]
MMNKPEKKEDVQESHLKERVQEAYLDARRRQEIVEVELNRAKIVMVGSDGKMKRVPILSEH